MAESVTFSRGGGGIHPGRPDELGLRPKTSIINARDDRKLCNFGRRNESPCSLGRTLCEYATPSSRGQTKSMLEPTRTESKEDGFPLSPPISARSESPNVSRWIGNAAEEWQAILTTRFFVQLTIAF